jgi:hypothetical protein
MHWWRESAQTSGNPASPSPRARHELLTENIWPIFISIPTVTTIGKAAEHSLIIISSKERR